MPSALLRYPYFVPVLFVLFFSFPPATPHSLTLRKHCWDLHNSEFKIIKWLKRSETTGRDVTSFGRQVTRTLRTVTRVCQTSVRFHKTVTFTVTTSKSQIQASTETRKYTPSQFDMQNKFRKETHTSQRPLFADVIPTTGPADSQEVMCPEGNGSCQTATIIRFYAFACAAINGMQKEETARTRPCRDSRNELDWLLDF